MSKIALFAGSFDPVTMGHADIIRRASEVFDKVYVTVFVNSVKQPMFTVRQRREMLEIACAGLDNVVTDSYDGLLVDYAEEKGVSVIVRGIRNANDLSYEFELAEVYRNLNPDLDTFLIPSKPEFVNINATIIREMLKYGKSIEPYVLPEVAEYIEKTLK